MLNIHLVYNEDLFDVVYDMIECLKWERGKTIGCRDTYYGDYIPYLTTFIDEEHELYKLFELENLKTDDNNTATGLLVQYILNKTDTSKISTVHEMIDMYEEWLDVNGWFDEDEDGDDRRVKINPRDFNALKKDTIENRIISAMIDGKTSIRVDQNQNHMGRCVDECLTNDEIYETFSRAGFKVKRLLTEDECGELTKVAGFVIEWASDK